LLHEIVLLEGHVMTLKKCDHEIKFEVKLKTKIGKSNYSVLVACRVPNAVNKASYLEIFCCNVLLTCTKVADLLFLNNMVKKFRNRLEIDRVMKNFPIAREISEMRRRAQY
jgi:hypothetical protein